MKTILMMMILAKKVSTSFDLSSGFSRSEISGRFFILYFFCRELSYKVKKEAISGFLTFPTGIEPIASA